MNKNIENNNNADDENIDVNEIKSSIADIGIKKTKLYLNMTRLCAGTLKNKDTPKWERIKDRYKNAGSYMNREGFLFTVEIADIISEHFFPKAELLDLNPFDYTKKQVIDWIEINKKHDTPALKKIQNFQKNSIRKADMDIQKEIISKVTG